MDEKTNVTDQILDLLLDALAERQRARAAAADSPELPSVVPQAAEAIVLESDDEAESLADSLHDYGAEPPVVEKRPLLEAMPVAGQQAEEWVREPQSAGFIAVSEPTHLTLSANMSDRTLLEREDEDEENEEQLPEPLPMIGLGRMLGRLALILALLLIIVNIPLNRFGTSLARAMPDEAALIIRDGLVLKGSDEKIYVLENNQLRWISSLEAFEYFGYRWEQVREVDDSFLATFEEGRPIHVLLKCRSSPHIYALEDGRKRWIKDIPTFEAEGYVWEDVMDASCAHLGSLPNGVPIPADAGTPP